MEQIKAQTENQSQMNNPMNPMGFQSQVKLSQNMNNQFQNNQMNTFMQQQQEQMMLQQMQQQIMAAKMQQQMMSEQKKISQMPGLMLPGMLHEDVNENEEWLKGFQLCFDEVTGANEEKLKGFQLGVPEKEITVIFRHGVPGHPRPPIEIQCMNDEKVSSLIERYRNKAGDYDKTKKFIFNAKDLKPLLSLAESGITNNANIFVVETKESKEKFTKKRKKIY